MGVLSWIIVGLIAGFIGSKIVNKTGEGVVRDIILGIIGAFVGGWIFTAMGHSGVTGVNLYSIFVAVMAPWWCWLCITPYSDNEPRSDRVIARSPGLVSSSAGRRLHSIKPPKPSL